MKQTAIKQFFGKGVDTCRNKPGASGTSELASIETPVSDVQRVNESDAESDESVSDKQVHKNKRKKVVIRKYNHDYLKYGFIANGSNPQCVVCGEVLSNEAMKPYKLKRHLYTKHNNVQSKSIDYFKRRAAEISSQKKIIKCALNTSEDALKASFLVALRISKSKKAFTIGEDLILPSMIDSCRVVLGEDAAKKIGNIPLSNNTVSRRIMEMADDVESTLIENIKSSKCFSIQMDESTDIVNKALLLVYVKYIDFHTEELKEDILNCFELPGKTTSVEVFRVVNEYLIEKKLSWENCVGVCTDGAAAMTGRHAGAVAKIKEVACSDMRATHCIIHREMLASKKMSPELNDVLVTAVKVVNVIKASSLNSRLFGLLCEEMGSEHRQLLLHAEVRWLSRGRVLRRLYELRNEVMIFLNEKNHPLAECFSDLHWLTKLAYLTDIFQLLNDLNLSIQGPSKTVFDMYNRVEGFKKKINNWRKRAENEGFDSFPILMDLIEENEGTDEMNKEELCVIVVAHLTMLHDKFEQYFPADTDPRNGNLWILDPFGNHSTESFTSTEEDSFADLTSDATLVTLKTKLSVASFWIKIRGDYPSLSEKAMKTLLPFSSTYLCESGFSAVTTTKTKHRNRLNLQSTLRLSLSSISPNIDRLMKGKQAQISH